MGRIVVVDGHVNAEAAFEGARVDEGGVHSGIRRVQCVSFDANFQDGRDGHDSPYQRNLSPEQVNGPDRTYGSGAQDQSRSMIVPVPSPPPQHIVTMPYRPSVRSSSPSSLVNRIVPVPPSG
jgi:hypothetical protein